MSRRASAFGLAAACGMIAATAAGQSPPEPTQPSKEQISPADGTPAAPPVAATPPPQAQTTPPQATQTAPMQPTAQPEPSKESSPVRTIVIGTGAATSAILVGTGIVFVILSNGKAGDAAALREELQQQSGPEACRVAPSAACQELKDLVIAQGKFANAAFFTLIGGGVAGAATLVYALATRTPEAPKPATTAAVKVLPWAAPGTAGVFVRAHW